MTIDEAGVQTLLEELTQENPLACRGLLGISRLEFTDTVATAAVSLETRPVLRVNLEFVRKHCARESHVKALLVHEFLHILLRHTLEIRHVTPTMNIALDAIINAIIHRKLGADFSGFMSSYYATAQGPLVLLRNIEDADIEHHSHLQGEGPGTEFRPDFNRLATLQWLGMEGFQLWSLIYRRRALHEDVLDFLNTKRFEQWQTTLANGTPVFLGNHAVDDSFEVDDLPGALISRLRASAKELVGQGILPGRAAYGHGVLTVPPARTPAAATWEKLTLQILRRLVVPDRRGRARELRPVWAHLPVLNEGDRRGLLQSLWNPLVGEIAWPTQSTQSRGSVAVYLDVSGSMSSELKPLVTLLNRFERHLRRPFWAFADTVQPALLEGARLVTRSTGGTTIACVVDHLRRTRPAKALIVTDGFVEELQSGDYVVPGTNIEVLLTSNGTPDVLRPSGWSISRLPPNHIEPAQ